MSLAEHAGVQVCLLKELSGLFRVEKQRYGLLLEPRNMKPESPHWILHAAMDCVIAAIACIVALVLWSISLVGRRNR